MSNKREITPVQAGKEVVAQVKVAKEAAKAGKKLSVSVPPAPPVKLGEVINPLIGKKGLKRAMVVAIVYACQKKDGTFDIEKASAMVRTSGILYKAGYTEEAKTDTLSQSEWTGRPYARFVTNTPAGKVYAEKHPEKVKVCEPFAHALKKAVNEEMHRQKEEAVKKEEPTPVVAEPATV